MRAGQYEATTLGNATSSDNMISHVTLVSADGMTSATAPLPSSSPYQDDTKLSASLLKLKIRNTTEYLNWRIASLKRDNFKCRMCNASIKDNKALRPEVHHAKSFNDICKENNITTISQP